MVDGDSLTSSNSQNYLVVPTPEQSIALFRGANSLRIRLRGLRFMRDEFGVLYHDDQFAGLFPSRGQPAASPAHLALVSVMQFAEGLSDRQAADAVRARIDWKYALGLELDASGFDATVLSEFRSRLIEGSAELVLFETLLTRVRVKGLLKARGRQRTDSTHVLSLPDAPVGPEGGEDSDERTHSIPQP